MHPKSLPFLAAGLNPAARAYWLSCRYFAARAGHSPPGLTVPGAIPIIPEAAR